jgi:antitoxin (DNA-binding transcriptional repressor) of toxin-antitoxin stability system
MRTAQVSELKERLDEVIEAVKNGETVEIREGRAAVAKLVPTLADFPLSDAAPKPREPRARSRKRANEASVRSSHSSKKDALDKPAEQTWESFFLDNLSLIDRVTAFVSRKYGLSGADAEDFASAAKLKLIEDDYAVLRKFEHKCSLPTYLTIVISRHYLDQKIHEWGKWRPSVRARQGGDAAIYLERLVRRDGLGITEASTIVRQKYTELDSRALEELAASIVVRQPRRSANVEWTEEMREPASEASAEDELMSIDRIIATLRESLLAAGVAISDIVAPDTEALRIADQIGLEGHIDELVRQGKARRGTGKLPADFLTRALPAAKKSVLAALLEDRHSD